MIVLGSRKSDLALWQAVEVLQLLERADGPPMCIRTEVAQGDVVLDRPLAALASGNPGLFTKELEVGLLSGAYDLAVHSLKDMPTQLPEGLVLAGISARDDPRDACVLAARHAAAGLRGLEDLPAGSIVGTSSLRREAFLRRFQPHLRTAVVRGNLNTRLRKLDAEPAAPCGGGGSSSSSSSSSDSAAAPAPPAEVAYDALLLAAAGLKRMGWAHRVSSYPSTEDCPYGVGQGALGIECRAGDARATQLARDVTHPPSALRCLAERAFLRALQGGCQVPIGVTCALLPSAPLRGGAAAAAAAAAAASAALAGEGGAVAPGDAGAADEAGLEAGGGAPAAFTLVLRGTVVSQDGATCVSAEVTRAVALPRGQRLTAVGAHGLAAVRSAVRSGGDSELRLGSGAREGAGEGGGVQGAPGSVTVRLGVTEEEWEALVALGEEAGRACAGKLLGAKGGAAVLAQLGLAGGAQPRPITYGAAEAPADR